MTHLATESILKYFDIKDNQLLIGGRTCEDIDREVGTPFYAYDLSVAKRKLQMLRDALPAEVQIHYAIKANPNPDILSFFYEKGTGFDVASASELKAVLDTGADPDSIGFAGPGKREYELRLACKARIGSLNAESVDELELANRIAGQENEKLKVSLRVNPAYELVGSGMKMGGGSKQFGIDQEKIPDVLKRFKHWQNLEFVGFHIFAGSQNLRVESILSAFKHALDTVVSFLSICPKYPKVINLGGGFGIPYYADNDELEIIAVGHGISQYLKKYQNELKSIKLNVETGRYLVGECGVYVCRVLYKKVSRGETFLVLDGGMHHHLSASGNFGQIIKRNFPICIPGKINHTSKEVVNIVGPLCTPLDRLGTKVELPEVYSGELVAFLGSGAYAFSASPKAFLSHPAPAEVILSSC